jgi:hypothetical protein
MPYITQFPRMRLLKLSEKSRMRLHNVALQATETVLFAPFWPPYTGKICGRSVAHTLFGQFLEEGFSETQLPLLSILESSLSMLRHLVCWGMGPPQPEAYSERHGRHGKGKRMDARGGSGGQVGGDAAITTRTGAVALPLGVILIMVAEYFHPSREDPMDNPAVFIEYAHSDSWTAVHLAQYFGFLLLIGGLVALYYSVSANRGAGAGLAPFGLAAAVTTAASFTVLQAVDGISLKRRWIPGQALRLPRRLPPSRPLKRCGGSR